jgi:creatinine amidohydrolase
MDAQKLSYVDLRRAADGVAVIPMGSFEAHGPHLPCGTDSLLVEAMVARAAAASDERRVVVFPTVDYSLVEWARPLASAGVAPATLLEKLADIARDVHGIGFRRIVFVQGHGNMPATQLALWRVWSEGARAMYVDACPYVMAAEQVEQAAGQQVGHAGLIETAMMLAAHPELVDMGKAVDGPDDLWGERFAFASLRGSAGVFCIPSIASLPDGVIGRATAATAELGEQMLEIHASVLAELFNDLLARPVPPEFLEPYVKDLPDEAGN